jgi:hypothetical protein
LAIAVPPNSWIRDVNADRFDEILPQAVDTLQKFRGVTARAVVTEKAVPKRAVIRPQTAT